MFNAKASGGILDFGELNNHINTYTLRCTVKGVHPFHQTLSGLMIILSPRSKGSDKRRRTVNNNEDSACFIPDFHVSMVNENDVTKIVCPQSLVPCSFARVASFLL